jgi:hypothetical protein
MNSSAAKDDYTYYNVPSPWLTVKLLRLLQLYSFPSKPTSNQQPTFSHVVCVPTEDEAVAQRLTESLRRILDRSQETGSLVRTAVVDCWPDTPHPASTGRSQAKSQLHKLAQRLFD